MVTFNFQVNYSFLHYKHHPITIKRKCYAEAERLGLLMPYVTIICPDGSRVNGEIIFGVAGYGPFYQIHFSNSRLSYPFRIGENLLVELNRIENSVNVILHAQ